MIEAKNLVKKYGNNTALHGVSFTFEDRRVYGFLGPNGAGKSTTMNIITGCLAATEGDVTVNGYDIYKDAAAAKRCIGYLPEQPPLYMDMTPYEYLTYVGRAKGLRREELADGVCKVIDRTGLAQVKDRLIRNLSKGYKQRVGIAQALLGDPEIIILDEPTVGLDPKQIIEIRELIRELGENHTVILSSHILTEISEVCDYAVIINNGRIVASDTIENITHVFNESAYINLEARCTESQAEEIISGINGIRSFKITKKGAGIVHVNVEGPKDDDLRDLVFFAFADAKKPIIAMSYEEASLEKAFLTLTEKTHEDELEASAESEKDDGGEYESLFSTEAGGGE